MKFSILTGILFYAIVILAVQAQAQPTQEEIVDRGLIWGPCCRRDTGNK